MIQAGLQTAEIVAVFEAGQGGSVANYEVFGEAHSLIWLWGMLRAASGARIRLSPGNYEEFGERARAAGALP